MLLAQLSLRWPRLLRFGTTVFKIALNNLCEGKKEQFSNRTIEKLFLNFQVKCNDDNEFLIVV
ncbi:hypothetical protein EFT52_08305 [Lacticaseibacillus paracasei]|nr:hypothetical protein [Lacticaseibacillus paracasei]